MKSLQILICNLLQAKHLVINPKKDEGVKMVLSYLFAAKYNCRTTYDLSAEAISIAIVVRLVHPADLIFLNSTLLMGALAITEL